MASPVQHFEITRKLDHALIQSQLGSRYTLGADSLGSLTRIYCDTYDWRLFRSDRALVAEPNSDGGYTLNLSDLVSGDVEAAVEAPAIPSFPDQLPAGSLQRRLQKLVKLRALLELAEVRVNTHTFPLVDEEGKTVARLVVEHNRLATDNGSKRLPSHMWIARVKGYSKAVERLRRALENSPGVRPARESMFEAALRALDQEPGLRRGQVLPVLDPETAADSAIRALLLSYLEILEDNRAGMVEAIDTEFLHLFRVALRRSRTLLRRAHAIFPPEPVARFSADFKWLSDATGPTRDLDVYLLEFDGYGKSISEAMRPDLEPLRDFLRRRRQLERQQLVAAMTGERYQKTMAAWRQFLTTDSDSTPPPPAASWPIEAVASNEIRRAYRRVLQHGQAIGPRALAAELHALRKDCKKLRYLIEAFRGLFDRDAVDRVTSSLKRLQDNLGTFNDLDVQSHALQRFAVSMLDEGTSPQTLLAMGVLIGHLEERSRDARKQFADRFAEFSRPKHTRFTKSIFRKRTEPGRLPE